MTTREAAEALGVTPRMVLHLIQVGGLKARKIGRDWHVTAKDLARVVRRGPGAPRKEDR